MILIVSWALAQLNKYKATGWAKAKPTGFVVCLALFCVSCSPIKPEISEWYHLDNYSHASLAKHAAPVSIFVTKPEAVVGYQTDAMVYRLTPFESDHFVHSAWVGPPADMLHPLMLQSLQRANYFKAVSFNAYAEQADYRLDSQLLVLDQRFLTKPSRVYLSVKAVVSNTLTHRVIASRLFTEVVPCAKDTPYGGVLAANQAVQHFTAALARFVVTTVERDRAQQ